MPTPPERNRVSVPDTRLVSQTTAAQCLGMKRRQQIPPIIASGRLQGEMVENVLFVTRDSLIREMQRRGLTTEGGETPAAPTVADSPTVAA